MFRVLCYCSKHRGVNVYWPTSFKVAMEIRNDYPGYRVVVYDAS